MNLVCQIILCVIYSILGCLGVVGLFYMIKEQRLILKNMTKPSVAVKPQEFLDYEKTIKNLNNHLTLTFQRVYTSMVLPDLKDKHGNSILPDQNGSYNYFVTKMLWDYMFECREKNINYCCKYI